MTRRAKVKVNQSIPRGNGCRSELIFFRVRDGKKIERHKIEATRIIPTYPSQVEVDLDIGHVFEPFSLKIEKHKC